LILGLTGSLGSGKSTVARFLEDLGGARVIDADEIAHQLQAPGGGAFDEIVLAFGSGILDCCGRIDRKKLASIVFADQARLQQLNSIVHSKVRVEELRLLNEYAQSHWLVVLMVPLLFENRMEHLVDRIAVVTVDEANRLKRLHERSGMLPDEVKRRISAQMPDEEKVRRADFVIDNSGSLDDTKEQVKSLVEQLKKAASAA
jgi:dephospho-CoA kinase